MNTELFKKIHDIIQTDPEGFDMDSWEGLRDYENPACGTTRCVAGWAVCFASGGSSLYDEYGQFSQAALDLAAQYGVAQLGGLEPLLAAKLLGLTDRERRVFYTTETVAAEFVRLAAEGEDEAARAVLSRDQ